MTMNHNECKAFAAIAMNNLNVPLTTIAKVADEMCVLFDRHTNERAIELAIPVLARADDMANIRLSYEQ
jgi:hypothetical protein